MRAPSSRSLFALTALLLGAVSLHAQVQVTSTAACPNGYNVSPFFPSITAGTGLSSFQFCIFGSNFSFSDTVTWTDVTAGTGPVTLTIGDIAPGAIILSVNQAQFLTTKSPFNPDTIRIDVSDLSTTAHGTFQVAPPPAPVGPIFYASPGVPLTVPLVQLGTPPYNESFTSGTVPPGMQPFPSTDQNWSGTPTALGVYTYSFQVSDYWDVTINPTNSIYVVPTPNITSLNPASAPAFANPFNLTLNGSGFVGTVSVQGVPIQGSSVIATPAGNPGGAQVLTTTYVNSGQLSVAIPSSILQSPGSYTFQVINPGNFYSKSIGFQVAPSIVQLSPSTRTAGSGSFLLTVTGVGFESGASILINGNSIATTPVGTTLTGTVPASAIAGVGSVPVTVLNPDSTVSPPAYITVVAGPTLVSLSPQSATAGSPNTALLINGTNFTSTTLVLWNGSSLSPVAFNSANQLGVTIPASLLQTAGSASVAVRTADGVTSNNLPFTISSSTLAISTTSLPAGVVGSTYSATMQATGGVQSYLWSASGLPPGLNISNGGVISGTPTTAGSYNPAITVTDSFGTIITKNLSISITAPTGPSFVTSQVLPSGTVGTLYNCTLVATGGTQPYSFVKTAGSYPPGINLVNGVLTGTPTTAGLYGFTIQVIDQNSQTANRTFSLQVSPATPPTLSLTAMTLANATVGTAVNYQFAATGGVPPYSFLSLTTLPPGVQLASSGALTGTPTAAGTYTFGVTVYDSVQASDTKTFSLTVNNPTTPALAFTTTSPLPSGQAGVAYSTTVGVTGGVTPYTWVATGLPSGLSIAGANGAITGTTSLDGTYDVVVTVTDSKPSIPSQISSHFSLTIAPATLRITTLSLPGGAVGAVYSANVAASGGTAPYTFTATGLPPGIALSTAGALSGAPTTAGNYTVAVTARDARTQSASASFPVTISSTPLSVTTASLAGGTTASNYSATLSATGGVPPYTWSASVMAPGLSLSPAGVITGTPGTAGSYTVSVTVTDSAGSAVTARLPITITAGATVSITTSSTLPGATTGIAYTAAISATGGVTPYTFKVIGGSLPPGLSMAPGGTIVGTPTTAGTYRFTVQVSDVDALTDQRDFSIQVTPPKLTLTTTSLANASIGVPASYQFTATGGVPPYTFVLAAGQLPPGLSLDPSGALTGTPTALGTYSFNVFVDDSAKAADGKLFTLVVGLPPLVITTASPLPAGQVGTPYSAPFAATGGKVPYTWTATGLPNGLTMSNSTGLITGIPSQAGTFDVAVTITDSNPAGIATTTAHFSLTITATKLTITTATLPNGTATVAYTASVAATGGTAPYTFSATGLPPGVNIASNGNISGTPTTAGTYTVAVTAKDAGSQTATASYQVVIAAQLTITTTSLSNGVVGTAYSTKLAATGGTSPYTWSGTGLPGGMTLAQDGTFSGTPATATTTTFTATVVDSAGVSATRSLSFTATLPAGPTLTINGLTDTVQPATQPSVSVSTNGTYPVNITVNLTLTFAPTTGGDDPNVVFASGGRTASIVVPAGSTTGLTQIGVQTGTVAGTITITARLLAGTLDITPTPAPTRIIKVPAMPPVITSVTAVRNSTGFTVTVIGYASTRDLTGANFSFTGNASGNLQTTSVSLSVGSLFSAYFSGSSSSPFGSQFSYTQPFNVTGANTAIQSVTVTLVSSGGTSNAATANLQ